MNNFVTKLSIMITLIITWRYAATQPSHINHDINHVDKTIVWLIELVTHDALNRSSGYCSLEDYVVGSIIFDNSMIYLIYNEHSGVGLISQQWSQLGLFVSIIFADKTGRFNRKWCRSTTQLIWILSGYKEITCSW